MTNDERASALVDTARLWFAEHGKPFSEDIIVREWSIASWRVVARRANLPITVGARDVEAALQLLLGIQIIDDE